MNAAPANQRELVRILYLEHGHQKAAELSKVPYDTVRQWAHRYDWKPARTEAMSQNVTKRVADGIAVELAEHERETKLSLARYARRAAKNGERATIREAPLLHKVGQLAGIVHKWGDEKQTASFTLNVLNINSIEQGQE